MISELIINESPSPCYLIDESLLVKNLSLLDTIQKRTGCRILLAQKGFSMYSVYPLISKYLYGAASSSLFEARLAREEMGKEVHIYSPAYREDEFADILSVSDHIVFNSFTQFQKYKPAVDKAKSFGRKLQCGIRVNPEYSEVKTNIYNPCYANSRLGTTISNFQPDSLDGIDGLHMHTMCEQGADVLVRTSKAFEEKFGKYIYGMKWLNFGGGHHITAPGYDIEALCGCIKYFMDKYGVEIYLEPGEAIALNTGYMIASVLDIMDNGMNIAIIDTSAVCHMPDVLEMPYRPHIIGSGKPGELAYTYRLGGPTCLAGDIIGDYSFDKPLELRDRLIFCDMAHYTMVKNNTFNGINLPSIAMVSVDGELNIIKEFGYMDFKSRL